MPPTLFSPFHLGPLTLPSRIVMSPMTRNRSIGNVPGPLVATYYSQRASAGLIVTEGTSPSPNGLGYARIPGIYSEAQVAGWKGVTAAVHGAGGRIFLQIMHTGRIGHAANLPAGAVLLGPSAVAAAGKIFTDTQGMQAHPVPREMTEAEIRQAIGEFAAGARHAVAAGFDGVELHSANGYLLEQFLNPGSNRRTDSWGGSIENRCRFVLETAGAVAAAIGKERTGIRLSPYGVFNDIAPFPEVAAQYTFLAEKLGALGLVYLHGVDHSSMGAPKPEESTIRAMRAAFRGAWVLSGGYDLARAEQDLSSGRGDLVAFGRPFVSNPDLPERLRTGAPLAPADMKTFYTADAKGYTDYPPLNG
ncbi:MAG: alkene reductase [Candidatus Brocadiae bacterium]|nr:alkene reductase [Candidatus Brocadiia bacterium]